MRPKRYCAPQVDCLEQRLTLSTAHLSLDLAPSASYLRLFVHVSTAPLAPKPAAPVAVPKPAAPVAVPKPVLPVAVPKAPAAVTPPTKPAAPVSIPKAPVPTPISTAPVTPPPVLDAFVNLGTGPYPEASLITSGGAQPWFDSTRIAALFGGQQPSAQQQAAFDSTVMQRIEQTFSNSGIHVSLTDTPGTSAPHTLSLVSHSTASILPTAIGMTDVGTNGFSFIDQEAPYAQTLDQFEWIVAHNISHELMLSFGVGENYDTTGNYVDARNVTLSMMISPSSTFSPAAAAAINQALAEARSN